ncbi:MAG: hypothetical protein M1823_004094 [Watsoniomyces obsoletus]|nr:MAG: hypothetical protein M1823_004094 [Watsoniomyces obsoletus]
MPFAWAQARPEPGSSPWDRLMSKRIVRVPTSSTSASTTIQDDPEEEIVIRDQEGGFQFEVPGIPLAQNTTTQKEREKERLAEAIKYHQKNRLRHPSDPAELLTAVHHSLRETAASLKEDNWMYEGEDEK